MRAYLVIRLSTDTPERLKDYQLATPAIIAQYHGKFLARGGKVVALEGPAETRRVVIIEFPSLADAEKFYHSPEYTQARKLREGIAIAEFIAVEGIE